MNKNIMARAGEKYVNPDYGFGDMMREIQDLKAKHPFVGVFQYGQSVFGRPLVALCCGRGERRVHVNASCHANEWITSALLMRFMTELSGAYAAGERLGGEDAGALLDTVALWAAPMVNPDGVELVQGRFDHSHPHYRTLMEWNGGLEDFSGWKANIRGVDLNDQFPAFWEEECKRRAVVSPSPRDYPGAHPLCEPEASALAELTDRLGFHAVVALHTQGREIYWNYRDFEPPHAETLAVRLGAASGYAPIKLSGSDAGYKDWFIHRYRRPGFTVEAGYGENPLPASAFESIYGELRPLLLESLKL